MNVASFNRKSMPNGYRRVSRFRIGQALLLFVFLAHSKVMSLCASRSMLRFRQHLGRSVNRPSHIFPSKTSIQSDTKRDIMRMASSFSYSDVQDGRQFFHKPKSVRDYSQFSEPACIKEYIPSATGDDDTGVSDSTIVQDKITNVGQNDATQAAVVGRRTRVPAVAPLSPEQLKANANRNVQNDWDYVSSIPIDPEEVLRRSKEQSVVTSKLFV